MYVLVVGKLEWVVVVWYLGRMNVLKGGKTVSVQDHCTEDSYKFLTGPPPACHRPGSAAAGTDLRSALCQGADGVLLPNTKSLDGNSC